MAHQCAENKREKKMGKKARRKIPDWAIDISATAALVGMGQSTVYAKVKSGDFPRQASQPSARPSYWRKQDVIDYLAKRDGKHAHVAEEPQPQSPFAGMANVASAIYAAAFVREIYFLGNRIDDKDAFNAHRLAMRVLTIWRKLATEELGVRHGSN